MSVDGFVSSKVSDGSSILDDSFSGNFGVIFFVPFGSV